MKKASLGLKIVYILLFVLGGLLVLVALVLLFGWLNHLSSNNVKVDATHENNTGLIQACGKGLYDKDGNEIILEGVNIGGLFVTEGWISPYAISTEENSQLSQEMFLKALDENPNLTDEEIYNLLDLYYKTWFTKDDVKRIADFGMNCIRLPFYYKNILNDDLTRKSEEEAFKYIDPILSWCKEYGIYVILDLHGCPGSQNGYEHGGSLDYNKTDSSTIKFWYNETYVDAVVDLWCFISEHYADSEYSSTIATYDLINEPRSTAFVTDKDCWDVYDKIYDAIRAKGDKHNITFEGCWSFSALPDPADYGWENVTYSYHWYNWFSSWLTYTAFYMYQDLSNIGRKYNVPVSIGEFTFFEDSKAWNNGLDMFKERHYSYTFWTYKRAVNGWWNDSWGLYNLNYWDDAKSEAIPLVNVDTATYDEIYQAFSQVGTENANQKSYVTYSTYNTLKAYFAK